MSGFDDEDPTAAMGRPVFWDQTVARPAYALNQATMALPSDKTIVPDDRFHGGFGDPAAVIARLPALSVDAPPHIPSDLRLKKTLGEGGMGQVWLAEQAPLARDVAVKSLRKHIMREPNALRAILQEAWITGWLQHPNIIPIYTLGRDATGNPLILMKRVEGNSWQDYLHKPEVTPHGSPRPLEWHLDVFIQICHVMEYAHTRGIVHRDLKPENVMIGRFGEVYVLDWGIAVSLREDLGGRLPMARDAQGLAGTPGYMPPEMASGRGIVDARSDVYLLGAILHELLTGAPPHKAVNVQEALYRSLASEPPTFTPDVPIDLATACHHAMEREREQRYQNVRELREAVEAYLEHRSSIELTQQAQASLLQLDAATHSDDPMMQTRAGAIFGECRFGFQQALRVWPENYEANRGLVHALETMLEFELRQENLLSARALAVELQDRAPVPPALLMRLSDLEQSQSSERQRVRRLERMEHDLRLDFTSGGRLRLLVVLGVLWIIMPLVAGLAEDFGKMTISPRMFFLSSLRVPVLLGVAIFWMRDAMFSNKANQDLSFKLLGISVAAVFLRGLTALNGVDTAVTQALEMLLYAFFIFILALATSPQRLIVISTLYLVGAYLVHFYPHLDDYILSACNLLVLAGIAAVLRDPDRVPRAAPSRR